MRNCGTVRAEIVARARQPHSGQTFFYAGLYSKACHECAFNRDADRYRSVGVYVCVSAR